MTPSTTTITGNLTGDPELRHTPAGTPVATFSVAINKRKRTPEGEWVDNGAEFFRVTAWRTLGENIAASLTKGARVVVTGRLTQRQWETDDHERRYAVEIVAEACGPDLTWATAKVAKTARRTDQPPPEAYDEDGAV